MSERIKQWWARWSRETRAIPKRDWDELDAAIREDERRIIAQQPRAPESLRIPLRDWRIEVDPTLPAAEVHIMQGGKLVAVCLLEHGVRIVDTERPESGL